MPRSESKKPFQPIRRALSAITGFVKKHPFAAALLYGAVGGLIVLDAWHLLHGVSPELGIKGAPTYAQIISTLVIALLVESFWITRSRNIYFSDGKTRDWPDARPMLQLAMVLFLALDFLFAMHRELTDFLTIGLSTADADRQMAATQAWAGCIELMLLAIGFFPRFLVADSEDASTWRPTRWPSTVPRITSHQPVAVNARAPRKTITV